MALVNEVRVRAFVGFGGEVLLLWGHLLLVSELLGADGVIALFLVQAGNQGAPVLL